MLHKALVIFLLLLISAHHMELLNCAEYKPGNGLVINSTCYPDGKVEYSWHYVESIDGVQINYNCTGNTDEHGIAYGLADNERDTRSRIIDNWNSHNTTCYFSGCYSEADVPFNTYSISSTPCTVLVPSSAKQAMATPTFVAQPTVVVSSSTISIDGETALTSTAVHPSKVSPVDKQTIKTAAILGPTATVLLIVTLLLLLMPLAVVRMSRKRRKHIILHDGHGYKVEIEDSFDITTKIRFSKSLETIPEALFYNEKDKNIEMRVRVESHIEGEVVTDSVLECGAHPLSTPSQEEEKMDNVEEEEEKERQCNALATLPPNSLPSKMMRETSASTSSHNSEYMTMGFSTGNRNSHYLFPVDNSDTNNLYIKKQLHGGNLFMQGMQMEIGMEANYDPMSETETAFQDKDEGNYLFGQKKSVAGYNNSGVTDGDLGCDIFRGSYYNICGYGDTILAAADQDKI